MDDPNLLKVEKYRKIYDSKIKRNKRCDTIVFGEVLGRKKAFLIQNMFPVIDKYIASEYRDLKSNELVKVNKILEIELEKKANKALFLERKGIKVILPNVLKIESKLIKKQLEIDDKTEVTKELKEAEKISKKINNSNLDVEKTSEEINRDTEIK